MSANIVLRQTAEQITINRSNPDILLVGVSGPVGSTGPAGTTGDTGPTGPTGASGDWATLQTIDTKTSSYTIVSSDVGKLISLDSSNALNLTLNIGTVIGTGARIDLLQFGAGQVTVGGTATIVSTPTLKLRTAYSAATLICLASNSYVLVGDLAVS